MNLNSLSHTEFKEGFTRRKGVKVKGKQPGLHILLNCKKSISMDTNKTSYEIIGSAIDVHNELGPGLLESVYQEALAIELQKRKIPFEREAHLDVYYKGTKLKKGFYADFFCDTSIILELKVSSSITNEHISQIMNYMRITKCKKGLILNFGNKSLEHRTYNLKE